MDTSLYGPVAMSQIKSESSAIYEALGANRRVLISLRGEVIASILPPDREAHSELLESYALGNAVETMSSTDLSQRYAGQFVERARSGAKILLTHRNVVRGVLTGPPMGDSEATVVAREALLAAFEEEHPDATPDEFAEFVSSLESSTVRPALDRESTTVRRQVAEILSTRWPALLATLGVGVTAALSPSPVSATVMAVAGASEHWSRLYALIAKARAYEAQGNESAAASHFRQAINESESLPLPLEHELLLKSEIAMLAAGSDPGAAIAAADEVLAAFPVGA